MRISTRGRYGVRAVLDLAMNQGGGPVSLTDISKRQEISRHYLEQLFNRMKNAGVVVSRAGSGGGYMLARSPREVSVGDIIRCVEGPLAPVECAVSESDTGCQRSPECVTRGLWVGLGRKIESYLDSVSMQDLCDETARMKTEKDFVSR